MTNSPHEPAINSGVLLVMIYSLKGSNMRRRLMEGECVRLENDTLAFQDANTIAVLIFNTKMEVEYQKSSIDLSRSRPSLLIVGI